MMAAADFSRSRGVAAYRTTKGLFFISTLLCLICLAKSQVDKDQLETFKENCEELQDMVDVLKGMYNSEMASAKLMSDYMTLIDPAITLMKKNNDPLPDDFPSVVKYMESIKVFMMDAKDKIDRQNERIGKAMDEKRDKLIIYQNLVKFLEKQQTELAFNSSEMVHN